MSPEMALSDVVFALKHGQRTSQVEVLDRGALSDDRPYLDIEVEGQPYRLILEDHGSASN